MQSRKQTKQLILVRHGQSEYNAQNRFTGIFDSPLTQRGIDEAKHCASLLAEFTIDHSFASALSRSQDTQKIILSQLVSRAIQHQSACLNERDYGVLTGSNKESATELHGAEQVKLWRRGFYHCPPRGESLAGVKSRVIPYYQENIQPLLDKGSNILIVSHGNTLRALIGHLLNFSKEQYEKVEVSWCTPWVFDFTSNYNATPEIIPNQMTKGANALPAL